LNHEGTKKQKKRQSTTGIRDKEGKLIIEKDQILQRWKDFDQLSNVDNKVKGENLDYEFDENLAGLFKEINTGPFTAELKRAIGKLKNGIAAGVDTITGKMLKEGGETISKRLLSIFENLKKNITMPDDWKKSMIAKIPKTGDLTKCDNSTGISLFIIPGKVFCRVLIESV
jgi:hypothetical protein